MKKIRLAPDTPDVIHQEQESILESLEAAGYMIEYQCREGMCGSCRCRLTSGTVDYQNIPLAALAPDEILPCITRAKTDICLELPTPIIAKQRA